MMSRRLLARGGGLPRDFRPNRPPHARTGPSTAAKKMRLWLAVALLTLVALTITARLDKIGKHAAEPVLVSSQDRGHVNHHPTFFSFLVSWSSIYGAHGKFPKLLTPTPCQARDLANASPLLSP